MSVKLKLRKGDRFGRLTLISELPAHIQPSGQTQRKWEAVCDCGAVKSYLQSNLVKESHTKSCGCLHKERMTKWQTGERYKTDLRNRWTGMKARCTNPDNKKYPIYGGRGITVCKRWENFVNFYEDMIEQYEPGLSLDRIDNNKGYSPDNCRWADSYTQNQNRRTSILIHGECITTACRKSKVSYNTLGKLRKENPNTNIEYLFDSLLKK